MKLIKTKYPEVDKIKIGEFVLDDLEGNVFITNVEEMDQIYEGKYRNPFRDIIRNYKRKSNQQ